MSAQPPPPPPDGPPLPPEDEWPTRVEPGAAESAREEVVERVEPGPPGPDRRIGLGLLLGLLLVVLAAGAIAAVWLLTKDDDEESAQTTTVTTTAPAAGHVEVPRLIGLKEPDALVKLGEAGLRPNEVYKPTAQPTKVVVSQKPAEATVVARDSQVTIVIDSGAPKVAIPDVVGLPVADAVGRLQAAGFDSQRTNVSSDKAEGTIVDQAPPAGTKAAKGSSVTLSVAKAQPVSVPDVVGQSKTAATAALESAGLKTTAVTVPSDRPEGEVVAQNPAPGTQVDKGATVRVNVSDGSGAATQTTQTTQTQTGTQPASTTSQPATATIPDVASLSAQAAVTRLSGSGLLASLQYVPSEEELGTVTAQSPKAGQTAKKGAHVTLSLASGPGEKPQKTVPDTVGKNLRDALSTLKSADLRLIFARRAVADQAQAGEIVEQTPAAGRTAPQNAQVLVYLGAFRR